MALIFIASSIPNLTHLPGNMSDKTGHGIGYGLLGLVLLRALRARAVNPASRSEPCC